jgi:hypothetical protein
VPTTCDLSKLVALAPPGAGRIHLHLPGYQPGKKPRSQGNAPLCGVFVYADAEQVSVREAAQWPHYRVTWNGSGDGGDRYWCPPCLGRLVVLLLLVDDVIDDAMAAVHIASAKAPDSSLTPPTDVGSVPGARQAEPETGTAGHDIGT